MRRVLEWLFRPWVDDLGPGPRAMRIYGVALVLSVAIVSWMIAHYGADGWLWNITASVVFFAPAGVLGFDLAVDRLDRRRGRGRTRGLARFAVLFAGLGAGIFVGYASQMAFPMEGTPDARVLLKDYRRSMMIVSVVVGLMAVGVALLWYRAEAFRFEGAMAKASLHALQKQLEPHFLFNALASLKELIATEPKLASEVTQQLADVYRSILDASDKPTIPLEQELALVMSYLEIERVRYGERLRFAIDVPPEIRGRHVPSLVLQTLVENAVKHGIRKARKGGSITVRAEEDGPRLRLVVDNTGAPYAPVAGGDSTKPNGTGLTNTVARLDAMYGSAHRFAIGPAEGGGTRVSFFVTGERS